MEGGGRAGGREGRPLFRLSPLFLFPPPSILPFPFGLFGLRLVLTTPPPPQLLLLVAAVLFDSFFFPTKSRG